MSGWATRRPASVQLADRTIEGQLRIVRILPDASALCGLGLARVTGVAELAAPGTLALARQGDGAVHITTDAGVTLAPAWLGGTPGRIEALTLVRRVGRGGPARYDQHQPRAGGALVATQRAQACHIQDTPMTNFSLTTLMYHYVHAPGDRAEAGSGIPGLSPERFAAQLDDFMRHYTMIAWPDLRAHLLGQGQLPPNACLLTFDDGTCDHYINVFPSLRERGLSGLFFVLARQPGDGMALGHKIHFLLARLGVAGLRAAIWARLAPEQQQIYARAEAHYRARGEEDAVDLLKSVLQRDLSIRPIASWASCSPSISATRRRWPSEYYLTGEQIAEMAAQGMHFGGHSRSHPWFDWIGAEQQADEIGDSAAWLGTVAARAVPVRLPIRRLQQRLGAAAAGPRLRRRVYDARARRAERSVLYRSVRRRGAAVTAEPKAKGTKAKAT